MKPISAFLPVVLAVLGTGLPFAAPQAGLFDGAGQRLAEVLTAPRFTDRERGLIRDYFSGLRRDARPEREAYRRGPPRGQGQGLPPGLAKRDRLPPGLQRGGQLPPGLQKQALPGELESRLPRRDGRYERAIVDGRVLLIDRVSNAIADVIEGVRAR